MDRRLHDMLMLVSRVQEKRGDIRLMVRQDQAVQKQVLIYLDDVQWLTRARVPAPDRGRAFTSKTELLAQVRGSRSHRFVPARVLGFAVSLGLLFAVFATNQQATRQLPSPIDQALGGLFHREDQVQASPLSFDLSTPAEASIDSSGPGFTN